MPQSLLSLRAFFANDRQRQLHSAAGLLGKCYRRPVDALRDCIELNGYQIVRWPLDEQLWGLTLTEDRKVVICSNLRSKLKFPETYAAVKAFTLAHELGHIRLHVRHHTSLTEQHEREADEYAGVFLMPRSQMILLPAYQSLTDDLHVSVRQLAEEFGVSWSAMAKELAMMGILRRCEQTRTYTVVHGELDLALA